MRLKLYWNLSKSFSAPLIVIGVWILGHVALSGNRAIANGPEAPDGQAGQVSGVPIPTGAMITPTAAANSILQDLNPQHAAAPDVRANGPASLALSPDGKL